MAAWLLIVSSHGVGGAWLGRSLAALNDVPVFGWTVVGAGAGFGVGLLVAAVMMWGPTWLG